MQSFLTKLFEMLYDLIKLVVNFKKNKIEKQNQIKELQKELDEINEKLKIAAAKGENIVKLFAQRQALEERIEKVK